MTTTAEIHAMIAQMGAGYNYKGTAMKKIISAAICMILALACLLTACAGKTEDLVYKDGMFTDVTADSPYRDSIAAVYEMGLMKGMRAGDVVLVRHHTIHKAEIDRSVQYDRVILYLDPRYFDRSAPESGLMRCFDAADRDRSYLLRPDGPEQERIKTILAELEKALEDGAFGAEVIRDSLVMQLLVQLNRATLRAGPAPKNTAADPKIEAVLSYINENLSAELTVDVLAERAYLSRYHFMLRDDYGYPVLSVDRPYNISSSIGQMRTRVQAFVESIEIKKLRGGEK